MSEEKKPEVAEPMTIGTRVKNISAGGGLLAIGWGLACIGTGGLAVLALAAAGTLMAAPAIRPKAKESEDLFGSIFQGKEFKSDESDD